MPQGKPQTAIEEKTQTDIIKNSETAIGATQIERFPDNGKIVRPSTLTIEDGARVDIGLLEKGTKSKQKRSISEIEAEKGDFQKLNQTLQGYNETKLLKPSPLFSVWLSASLVRLPSILYSIWKSSAIHAPSHLCDSLDRFSYRFSGRCLSISFAASPFRASCWWI